MRSQQERFLKTLDVEVISRLEIMHSQKLSKEEKEELKDPPNETWQLKKLQEVEPQIRKIINSSECQQAVRTYLENVIAAKEPTGQ